MKRDLTLLADREHDLVVVGGGIFGLSVAWDAALRGLSVALLDREDFSAATSAHSFRMIHGGIRYLQHADLRRIRESCRERRALLRMAPHLTRPLPIAIPTYARGLQRKVFLRCAFLAYDLATLDRNAGIPDPARRIPQGRFLSRDECLRAFPGLDPAGLTGAGLFHDGQMYNPPRLAFAILEAAMAAGAVAANHLEATRFLRSGDRIVGVTARDTLSGEALDVRGRLVVNAAGPWAHRLLQDSLGRGLDPVPAFSRDACFIVRGRRLGDLGLAVQGKTSDPDAVLARGKRHLFVVPWRDHTLVGVWHVVHRGHPDAFTVERAELQTFLDEINEAYPPLALTADDVSMWNAGLVLFGDNREDAVDLRYGHRSRLEDHARTGGPDGLITVVGVRWTTARGMAEQAVDLAFRKLGWRPPRCTTETSRVPGGDMDDFEAFVSELESRRPDSLEPATLRALAHNHGTLLDRILRLSREDPSLAVPLAGTHVLRAEVAWAVREEMAETLADVVLRRTDLATGGHPGAALEECADLVANELGWDLARRHTELTRVVEVFPSWLRAPEGGSGRPETSECSAGLPVPPGSSPANEAR